MYYTIGEYSQTRACVGIGFELGLKWLEFRLTSWPAGIDLVPRLRRADRSQPTTGGDPFPSRRAVKGECARSVRPDRPVRRSAPPGPQRTSSVSSKPPRLAYTSQPGAAQDGKNLPLPSSRFHPERSERSHSVERGSSAPEESQLLEPRFLLPMVVGMTRVVCRDSSLVATGIDKAGWAPSRPYQIQPRAHSRECS